MVTYFNHVAAITRHGSSISSKLHCSFATLRTEKYLVRKLQNLSTASRLRSMDTRLLSAVRRDLITARHSYGSTKNAPVRPTECHKDIGIV